MIGNEFLQELFEHPDRDTGLNQLLELLHSKDKNFIDSLYQPVDLDKCNPNEKQFLTLASSLIDFHLQLSGLEVPLWLRDERLSFETPFFYPRRLTDFDRIKLMYTNPGPFRARNVYFDMDGITRI